MTDQPFNLTPRKVLAAVPTSAGRASSRNHARMRRGFSFTEILFAVMVLGIGFIMIAAIFPVAIKQTQATTEETVASTIAKGAVSYLSPLSGLMATADNAVHQIVPSDTIGLQLSGSLILPSDPRYAWVSMYRRGFTTDTSGNRTPAQFAQVIVIAVQARNRTTYDVNDLGTRADGFATLQARPMTANFTYSAGGPDIITFSAGPTDAIGPGAYVVIASDPAVTDPTVSSNGFIYRVGNNAGGTSWQLMPGNDTLGATVRPTPGQPISVLAVGRGYDDATATSYSGPVQDAAVYTTFVTP